MIIKRINNTNLKVNNRLNTKTDSKEIVKVADNEEKNRMCNNDKSCRSRRKLINRKGFRHEKRKGCRNSRCYPFGNDL